MTDVNPLTVVVLSLANDPTVSTETVRECFDLIDRGQACDGRRSITSRGPWTNDNAKYKDKDGVMARKKTRVLTFRAAALSVLLLTAWLGGATSAAAQTASGVIAGTIADSQGGSLPGATLTVRSVDTGAVRSSVTEADGRYRIAGLQPGTYDVRAELEGFGTVEVKGITLTLGLEVRRDLALGLKGLEELVTVRGEAPLVEVTNSEVAAVVSEQQIASLPVEGRSAVSLSLLLPGTSTDAVRAQRPGATVGLGGLSTAGTNFIVDGMNNMISRAGDAREDVPQSAIREFKVIVSQPPAEYGGRVGGVVNVVTKSGTNLFRGEAFEFFRDKSLNRVDLYAQQAHDQLGTPISDFRRDQFVVGRSRLAMGPRRAY